MVNWVCSEQLGERVTILPRDTSTVYPVHVSLTRASYR